MEITAKSGPISLNSFSKVTGIDRGKVRRMSVSWVDQLQEAAFHEQDPSVDIRSHASHPMETRVAQPSVHSDEDRSNKTRNGVDERNAAAPKINRFTRPDSAHEELGAGFSYQKARKQTLNLQRRQGYQHDIALILDELQSSRSIPFTTNNDSENLNQERIHVNQRTIPTEPRLLQQAEGVCKAELGLNDPPSGVILNILGDKIEAVSNVSLELDTNQQQSTIDADVHRSLENKVPSKSQDATQPPPMLRLYQKPSGDVQSVPPSNGKHQDFASRPHSLTSVIEVSEPKISHISGATVQTPQKKTLKDQPVGGVSIAIPVWPRRGRSSEARELPRASTKIVKAKKKLKRSTAIHTASGQACVETSANAFGQGPPSEEDLLNVLLFLRKKAKEEQDVARALQRSKDAELRNVKDSCGLLSTQLQDLREREKIQNVELNKYRTAVPSWKVKLRKLDDYVKGLTNDHHKLRDDAMSMQKRQDSLCIDREAIEKTFAEARSTLNLCQAGNGNILLEARHRVDVLEQAVADQKQQIEKEAQLLDMERKRNTQMEHELSTISCNQVQMLEHVTSDRQAMVEKFDSLLHFFKESQPSPPSKDEEHRDSMLSTCVNLLQGLHHLEVVKPEDLRRLDSSIKSSIEYMIEHVQARPGILDAIKSERHGYEVELQKQLQFLGNGIKTEHILTEQMSNLREAKATVRERLQASETALVEARHKIIDLQKQEDRLSKETSSLKGEVKQLQNRPADAPATVLRLQQMDSYNDELRTSLSKLQLELTELTEAVKGRDKAAVDVQNQFDALETQLAEAQAANNVLQEQKSANELHAKVRYEDLREQLLKASASERATLINEHSNISYQVTRQKATAEARAEQAEIQLEKIKTARSHELTNIYTETLNQLRATITSLEAQGCEHERLAECLRGKLNRAEEALQSKDAEIQTMSESISSQDRQRVDLEQKLAITTFKLDEQVTSTLARINVTLKELDNSAAVQDSIEDALAYLPGLLDSMRSAQQSQSNSSLAQIQDSQVGQVSQELETAAGSPLLVDRPESKSQDNSEAMAQPRQKANLNQKDSGGNTLRETQQNGSMIENSQIEETTIHRSVRRTVSSQGRNDDINLFDESPVPSRDSKVETVSLFSKFRQEHSQLSDPASPLGDMSAFFPPTPDLQPRVKPPREGISASQLYTSQQSQSYRQDSSILPPGSQSAKLEAGFRPPGRDFVHGFATSDPLYKARNKKFGRTSDTLEDSRAFQPKDSSTATRGETETKTSESAKPRGILKRSAPNKRNASTAGLEGRPHANKRSSAVEKQDLGPIIPESQRSASPRTSVSKSRVQRRNLRRSTKDDKYKRRFSAELE